MVLAQATETYKRTHMLDDAILRTKLDEAIEDMESGRIQTIDEAWEEIDTE